MFMKIESISYSLTTLRKEASKGLINFDWFRPFMKLRCGPIIYGVDT